ncbi:hypothetical protein [Ottowia sp.]|uniref:hypothetical protein n=1 Tax=Ottowia sp. TaxID=1898956 RepID=UPI0025D10D44|nr:hypothetical protein [Ottowia sp.]MBK6614520.1 hypothetical protein [Ottowia sp.]MBK6747225.1 hypothetical protein [Ottowia sp.]
MKPFVLDATMTSLGGVFYPTGHVFALFPDEDRARQAAAALHAAGHAGGIAHASPDVILQEIVQTLGTADTPLPSVGAEGDMVRRIADLAGTGHHGLLIEMAGKDHADALVSTIAAQGAVAAFHYRAFIIEDLIATPSPDGAQQSVTVGTHAAPRS